MKRIIALALLLMLLLAGCSGSKGGDASTAAPTTVPPEVISNYIGEGLTTQLRTLADNAVYTATELFDFGSLPCSGDAVSINGKEYFPVTSEKFKTYAELEAYISGIFTPEAAKALLESGKYIENNGVFLCNKSAYSANTKVNLSSYTVSVNKKSSDEIEIALMPEGASKAVTLTAVNTGSDWRIKAPLDITELTGGATK